MIKTFNSLHRLNRFSFFEQAIPAMKLSDISSYLKALNWLGKNSRFSKQAIPVMKLLKFEVVSWSEPVSVSFHASYSFEETSNYFK